MQYEFVISLLVYNQLEITKKCIKSILDNTTGNYLLVISDNASRYDTANYLKNISDSNKNIVYIRNEDNIGFIKAHNNIYNTFKSKYFCVLNNDIIIHTKGWDKNYIEILDSDEKIAQVGPIQQFGYIDGSGTGSKRYNGEPLDYIEGSCFIVKRDAINKCGGLFEDKYMMFAFCEDADLSLRLKSNGYNIIESNINDILHLHNMSFKNETVNVDFRRHEHNNKRFLLDRWRKYFDTRVFSPLKILVDRQGAIGDTLCIEPVLRELIHKYPNCEIYVDTICADALKHVLYLKEVRSGLKNKYKYDMVIDLNLAYEKVPTIHLVDAYALTANVILDNESRIPVYKNNVDKTRFDKKTIVVCSQGSWPSRTWDLDRWKIFISYLKNVLQYDIIEVGSDLSLYLGIGQNKISKLSIHDTIDLIAKADLYVGFDGGLMHFAQSVGTPVFIIFGCTCPNYRIHDWSKARVVWLDKLSLDCAGCHHTRPSPRCHTDCDRDKTYCLSDISIGMVIDKFNDGEYNCPTIPVVDTYIASNMHNFIYECFNADVVFHMHYNTVASQKIVIDRPTAINSIKLKIGTYYKSISCKLKITIFDSNNNIIFSQINKIVDMKDNAWNSFSIPNVPVKDNITINIEKIESSNRMALFLDSYSNNICMIVE